MQHVPTDTTSDRRNPWQLQYPNTYPQSAPAVLGPQEAIQLVTQRARGAMCARRETARRALLRQQGECLAATDQYEAAARKNFVNTLARNNEAHNDNVQVQALQLEHKADARFSQRHMELLSRSSLERTQALEDQRDRHQKHGDETSKYMIYVQNWVFMHFTRKTLCNNEVDNTLDYIST